MSHGFYLALAYGLGVLLVAGELVLLWRRCRRAAKLEKTDRQ